MLTEESKQLIQEKIDNLKNQDTTKNDSYYEKLGLLYYELDEKDHAIENLEESLKLKPSVGDGYKKLMTLYNSKRAEAAKNGDDEGIETYMNKLDELRQIARKHTIS